MFNRATICGRITADLVLKQTDKGRAYVRFTLAVNSSYNKMTDYIPVVVWNQPAENLVKYLGKGSLVLIDGQIQVRTIGEEPNRRTFFDVTASRVVYLETKRARMQMQANQAASNPSPPETPQPSSELNSSFSSEKTNIAGEKADKSVSSPAAKDTQETETTNQKEDDIFWEED